MIHPFLRFSVSSLLIGAGLLLAVAPAQGAKKPDDSAANLNAGYYLLYHVSDPETSLPMLFVAKTADPAVKTYGDHIAKVAKETTETLEGFQDHDASIQFDENPLPQIEQDARESIASDKQHQLLFGTTDKDFDRYFLVTQIEAMGYAQNLCKVLADQETSPARAKALDRLATQWQRLQDEGLRLLRNF